MVSARRQARLRARQSLAQAFASPQTTHVIHYSCEGFLDREEASSPRITSIAVQNLGSGQVKSYSIHQSAELHGKLPEISDHYECLEKSMLDRFYEFARGKESGCWLHWSMRDINYGFEAIEHRYRVLGGEPAPIDPGRRVDVAEALKDIYGKHYVPDPRMLNVAELNEISTSRFLPGGDEAKAFEAAKYVDLHQSTLRKVRVIASIARLAHDKTLKTNARWRERYDMSITDIYDSIMESSGGMVAVLAATALTILTGAVFVWEVLNRLI